MTTASVAVPVNGSAPADSASPKAVNGFPGSAKSTKAPVASVALGPGTMTESSRVTGLYQSYAPLGYMLPFESLHHIELLATYNPDYSQAVENIKTLANSGHELFVSAGSDLQQKRIKDLLEDKARTIQGSHGGIDGLIDKLLDQAATFGAMCGEWILNEDATDVVDFADINPKTIRYFWDKDLQRYVPYQKVTAAQAAEAKKQGQEVLGGCVRLNEATFHYFAFDAAPNSPYGTPPFLAALGNIAIQRDMVANLAQIVKKVGLLGIVDVVAKALPTFPGETAEQYQARAGQYLDAYVEVIQEMVRDGGVLHYDDIEVKTTSVAGNAAGATAIFKQNEELVFSGLKSMPSVQGRSYSTTETYAGVAYDIIIRNTKKYQRGCKRMIESGYWLIATLNGLRPTSISLNFNENKTLHRMQDAQAEAMELKNGLVMWICGLIDQRAFGQRVGISNPVKPMEQPPESPLIDNAGNVAESSGNTGGDNDNTGSNSDTPTRSDNVPEWVREEEEAERAGAAGEG